MPLKEKRTLIYKFSSAIHCITLCYVTRITVQTVFLLPESCCSFLVRHLPSLEKYTGNVNRRGTPANSRVQLLQIYNEDMNPCNVERVSTSNTSLSFLMQMFTATALPNPRFSRTATFNLFSYVTSNLTRNYTWTYELQDVSRRLQRIQNPEHKNRTHLALFRSPRYPFHSLQNPPYNTITPTIFY
jgi:hypothetical protein